MGRWTPNTRERLAQAALELYLEHGYAQTTVAEIAGRAGTTERTFFRHFVDKSEVLFGGSQAFQELIVGTLSRLNAEVLPLEAVMIGFEAAEFHFQGDKAPFQRRQELIGRHPELLARELHKMATLGTAITLALRERGTPEPAASLTAETGLVVFKVAYDRWLGGAKPEWAACLRQTLSDLRGVLC